MSPRKARAVALMAFLNKVADAAMGPDALAYIATSEQERHSRFIR